MTDRLRSCAAATVAAVGILTFFAAHAAAQELRGPEFGSSKVSSSLQSLTDRPDVDEYTSQMLPGETISVKVSAAKGSAARFDVRVLDPDGNDRTSTGKAKSKKDGAKVQVNSVPVDVVGPWTVRIAGRDGTQGAYQATFKIGGAKPVKLKNQTLSGAAGDPDVAVHGFGAVDGGLIDAKVKWAKKGGTVTLRDLRGPDGTVSGIFGEDDEALAVKPTSLQLKKHRLDAGTGTHALEVGSEGAATYSVALKITPPARPSGKREISSGNDPQLDAISQPIRTAPGQTVRISGRNFALSPPPQVFFGALRASIEDVGPARNYIDVLVPPGADGETLDLLVVNPDGQTASHPDYVFYVAEAVVDAVSIASGPVLGDRQVRSSGGAVLEVSGRNFQDSDVVTLENDVVVRDQPSGTSFRVTVPAGAAGPVTFRLTDVFGRQQVVTQVVRRVGFVDRTAAALPAASEDDDLSVWDAAIGDLDNDAFRDDLIVVTYNEASRLEVTYGPDPNGVYVGGVRVTDNSIGDRQVLTRMFFRELDGKLHDVTDDRIPANGSDDGGKDDLNALCVAIGDIDDNGANDIVIGGSKGPGDASRDYDRVRVLLNDGDGYFSHGNIRFDPGFRPKLDAFDETYVAPDPDNPDDTGSGTGFWKVSNERTPARAVTSLAVGDLDGDGDLEIVAGSPEFSTRELFIDPTPVDVDANPPYINSGDVSVIDEQGRSYYYSATQIFDNALDTDGTMNDVTGTRLPTVGDETDPGHVSFRARHLLLGDVDDDDDLDLLVTWNNPASLVPASAKDSFGSYPSFSYGVYRYRFDADTVQEAVSTRILLNDGSGVFSDETATWLPPGAGDEMWHAHRMALADLDGDDDLDLVLLHRRALNAFRYGGGQTPPTTTRPSLRVLRNDGTKFVDVTSTALPAALVGRASWGRALTVGDIDRDGRPEIVFGATYDPDELNDFDPSKNRQPPFTRILWNRGNLVFELNADFEFSPGVDTGEVNALLVGDVDRDSLPDLLMFGERTPAASPGGALMRDQEWHR